MPQPPETPSDVKPRLRGWLHLGAAPVALAIGSILASVAASGPDRWAVLVFTLTSTLLFGTSALYHRGNWGTRTKLLLKRVDHSNIFLIIAGTYTPFAIALLPGLQARTLLLLVWSGAILGVLFRISWTSAPRWVYTPAYVLLGWVAVLYLPAFLAAGGGWVVGLLVAGGIAYTLGAVVYASKRPDLNPAWYGFHELFHSFTLLGYVLHGIGIFLAIR